MAHFFESGYPEDSNAYVTEKNQLRKLTIRMGGKVHVRLWGGGPNGEALQVAPKDTAWASITDLPGPWAPDTRMFRITPSQTGSTQVEAKTVTGSVWASAELTVTPLSRRSGGPKMGNDG